MPQASPIGSPQRPLKVAIVGAGPSGFYAAEALFKAEGLHVHCDMLDRLPTPFGLVRGGVAPDHQSIKRVVRVYERIASDERFHFYGNVCLGRDITVDDLKKTHDAIIYAFGNESDRRMGIPGEDLPGSHSATEFVGWYNGHPDYTDLSFDLSCEAAVIVGVGNVAMDVARVLARHPDELLPTDIAAHALPTLEASKIKRIYVLGRRGGAQAAFSPKEIKELAAVPNADLIVAPEEAALDAVSEAWLPSADRDARKNAAFLAEQAEVAPEGKDRQVILKFLVSPVALEAGGDGRVSAVKLRRNELYANEAGTPRPRATEVFETLKAGLVFKAVGYRGVKVPGVPFHERWGTVPNVDGRVVADADATEPIPGEYVVGWAKRGPSGLIGTNKPDSIATVAALLDDYRGEGAGARWVGSSPQGLDACLNERGHRFVTYAQWQSLDAAEIERGKAAGKLREKFVRVEEMLAALG